MRGAMTKIRLTRKINEISDEMWFNTTALKLKAGNYDDDVDLLIDVFRYLSKQAADTYSGWAMKRGVRIYPDEYESEFMAAFWRTIELYNGSSDYQEYIGDKDYPHQMMIFKRAAVDVWRRCTTRKELINRRVQSIEKIADQYEIYIEDPHNTEDIVMENELMRLIEEHADIDDVTKRIVRLFYEGATLREIAPQVGLNDPKQVQRKLQSLKRYVSNWNV